MKLFKPTASKVFVFFLVLLFFPIRYKLTGLCGIPEQCDDIISYTLPIIDIYSSLKGLIGSSFSDIYFGFDLFAMDFKMLINSSSFWINLIFSYPIACIIIYKIKGKK